MEDKNLVCKSFDWKRISRKKNLVGKNLVHKNAHILSRKGYQENALLDNCSQTIRDGEFTLSVTCPWGGGGQIHCYTCRGKSITCCFIFFHNMSIKSKDINFCIKVGNCTRGKLAEGNYFLGEIVQLAIAHRDCPGGGGGGAIVKGGNVLELSEST